jgi:hypothetical protein
MEVGQGPNVGCSAKGKRENALHVLDFPFLKTVLLLLASCKHEHNLTSCQTANEDYSKTGVTDIVPPFPPIILQKVFAFQWTSLYAVYSFDHCIHHFTRFCA